MLSDECYAEFTWAGPARTILQSGLDGVLAVHSLSKRSNLAGVRVGFVAGDGDLVGYLADVRRHAGLMVPGPAQAAAAVALSDDEHVGLQRDRYLERLRLLVEILGDAGIAAELPAGAFYIWVRVPEGMPATADESRGWGLARWLASEGGVLASPGEFYGPAGDDFVRLAAVQPIERIEMVAKRLAGKSVS